MAKDPLKKKEEETKKEPETPLNYAVKKTVFRHADGSRITIEEPQEEADPTASSGQGSDISDPDMVNEPPHYRNHPSGVECIQITEHMNFNIGNAIKYLWRSDEKGAPLQDLEKARWYVDREIKRRGGESLVDDVRELDNRLKNYQSLYLSACVQNKSISQKNTELWCENRALKKEIEKLKAALKKAKQGNKAK